MTTSGRLRLLTDEQCARLADCLPHNAGKTGRPFADHRRIIDGIIYRYRTGSNGFPGLSERTLCRLGAAHDLPSQLVCPRAGAS